MSWIKANERLPDRFGRVHWRDAKTKLPVSVGVAYVTIKKGGNTELIEWLDESSEADSLKLLLRELFMKTQMGFPQTEQDIKWFEAGTGANTEEGRQLMLKIMGVLNL